jgi:Phage integrase family
MKNLRWRDIMPAKDREGREIVVLFVQGKGKSRKLVAPRSVGEYLERIRAISKAAEPNDRVFTNVTGKPAKTLYTSLIADLLNEANLREGTQGVPRSTYCFRHTYATLRLQEGVDVYFLAEQMGTSVHMIEQHYGHVNTIKHADRVLQGMAGWELPQPEPDDAKAKASKAQRPAISPKEVGATSRADREPPEAVFCRSRWRRLAQGGNRPTVPRILLTEMVLICCCPAGAFLAANLRARAAAGGCSSCALVVLPQPRR